MHPDKQPSELPMGFFGFAPNPDYSLARIYVLIPQAEQCVKYYARVVGGYPTNDVRLMTRAANEVVNRLFRPEFKYSKAEVLLLDLRQPGEFTDDMFAASQLASAERMMGGLDEINTRWGRGALRTGSVPFNPEWAMRRELMSDSYTIRLDQLWEVKSL